MLSFPATEWRGGDDIGCALFQSTAEGKLSYFYIISEVTNAQVQSGEQIHRHLQQVFALRFN